jgi:hypothetical protein
MKAWICIVVALAGCKKHEGGGAAASAGGDLPDELAKWMPANAHDLLQGVWETHISFYDAKQLDVPAALEIKGDTAHAFDGKTEHTLQFSLKNPCQFALSESAGGGEVTYTKFFLAAGGKLAAIGDGAGGYRKGKEAIVCAIGREGLVVADATGACKAWEVDFFNKKWKSTPTQCQWTQKDGKDALQIGKPDDPFSNTLVADGDLLWSDQLRDEAKTERFMKRAPDYAAAKAWAESERKARDPGEQAKVAGGKVGDTSTVAGLQASYAADKSLKGKAIELTALYLNNNSATSGGKTTYNVIVVDSKDNTKITLMCNLKDQVKGLVQWDKVKVKGTVGDFMDEADLEDCTVTKAP